MYYTLYIHYFANRVSDPEVLANSIDWTTLTPLTSTPSGATVAGSSGAAVTGSSSCEIERLLLKKEHAAKMAKLEEDYLTKKNAYEQEYFTKDIEILKTYSG